MIYERDKMIGDKEKKIYDLKKRFLSINLLNNNNYSQFTRTRKI